MPQLLLNKKSVQEKSRFGFTVFDIETNGLETSTPILEIAAVKLTDIACNINETSLSSFERLVYFNGAMNPAAFAVHKIDPRVLRDRGLPLKEVLRDFVDFAGDSVIVGHNIVSFDLRVLSYHLERHEVPLRLAGVLDTCILARKLVKNVPNYRLATLCAYFNTANQPSHRARADVLSTAELFQRLSTML